MRENAKMNAISDETVNKRQQMSDERHRLSGRAAVELI